MKGNVLLQGEIGSGKTYCLHTLVKAGLDTFIISMEPGLEATLGDYLCDRGPIHHHYIKPGEVSWEQIAKYAALALTLSLSQLIKTPDPSRASYDQYSQLLATCRNFRCDGCHKEYGRVEDWEDDRALAVDGLSGVTKAAKQMIIGARPVIGKEEYQPIQGYIEVFLDLMWSNTRCTAVLIAHTDMRQSEETGINQLTIDTAGPALVRKLIRKPDEIITTERNEKGEYTWNTLYSRQTVTKRRRLPESADLEPDFSQLFKS